MYGGGKVGSREENGDDGKEREGEEREGRRERRKREEVGWRRE